MELVALGLDGDDDALDVPLLFLELLVGLAQQLDVLLVALELLGRLLDLLLQVGLLVLRALALCAGNLSLHVLDLII